MFATINDCQSIARVAKQFDVELPAELARPLQTYDAVQRARSGPAAPPVEVTLAALMAGDEIPTVEALSKVLDENALRYARSQITREVSESAERLTVEAFRKALMGLGGDELFDRLRPRFDEAYTDMREIMALVSPGMTGEQAIDAGPETVAAWAAAPSVMVRLNAFIALVTPIWREFNLVGNDLAFDHYFAKQAAFFIDAEQVDTADLTSAGVGFALVQGHVADYRLGGWQSMVIETGHALRLNSPREADALCRSHMQSERAEEDLNQTHPSMAEVG